MKQRIFLDYSNGVKIGESFVGGGMLLTCQHIKLEVKFCISIFLRKQRVPSQSVSKEQRTCAESAVMGS